MTEPGSDELLYAMTSEAAVSAFAKHAQFGIDAEEDAVLAATPEQDPGTQYPEPDEVPDGEPEEYDPLPLEAS